MDIYIDPKTENPNKDCDKKQIMQKLLETANKIDNEYRRGKPKPCWVIPSYNNEKEYIVIEEENGVIEKDEILE